MTKVGMLGAGFILGAHAASVRALPGAELHMIADAAEARARGAAQTYGFAHHATSIEAMARSDCDVVHILLPPVLHAEAALEMLRAGKSVFVEKPFALDSAACAELAAEARQRDLAIGANHNFLFGNGYQQVRDAVRSGAIGPIDHVELHWLYELPFIKHGPFDNWIVSAPVNPLFEIGPHLMAFALDLLGDVSLLRADASKPVTLPSGIAMPRRWHILGEGGGASVAISLSFMPGHADRSLTIRGSGGSISYDFGRDVLFIDKTTTDNPMLDSRATAKSAARQYSGQASRDYFRRMLAALRRSAGTNAFEESVANSVAHFHANQPGIVDERHSAEFAGRTIALCEAAAQLSGLGAPSRRALAVTMPEAAAPPTVLVVGGTGFIGRKLVEKLIAKGLSVRVVSRSARHAAMMFRGVPVEIFAGSHGNAADVDAMLAGIDTVYHLAKCEGKRWQDYVEGDVRPTETLARAAAKAGIRRFIYTGTIDSYHSADPRQVIDNRTPVDGRIAGRNLYARSKAACEALLTRISAESGMPLVIMRPGIVIGPGSPPAHLGVARFSSDTRLEYWGNGLNRLPFVHVDDVADALAAAADAPGIDGATLLVSGPPLLSGRDYVAALEAVTATRIDQMARSPLRFWLADFVKEAVKNAIRHPNRRRSTLRDWQCKTHRARYCPDDTMAALNWHPIADRETLIACGIRDAVGI